MKIAVVALLVVATPAYALDFNDNMQVWKRSPNALRVKLLNDPAVAGRVKSNQVGVLECMNKVTDPKMLLERTVKEAIDDCTKG
jgi:hypothetical protein